MDQRHQHRHRRRRLGPRLSRNGMPQQRRTIMSNLNEFGITHLRHVDLAVPDYDTQRTFYKDTWGLTEVGTDGDLSYLAAEGSPEQYVIRLRKAADKRLDLISFGADGRGRGRRARREARHRGHPAGRRARQAADRRRRLRLPVLRHRRPHHRDLQRRRDPPAPRDRGGRGDPGAHLARGDELQRPQPRPATSTRRPRLQAQRHPLGRAHGRDDALHAVQRLAPQPGDRRAARTPRSTTCRSRCAAWTSTCAAPAA